MQLGNGRRERLLRHATSSRRQGGQEHHGTVSTNVADYKEKDLQAAFASATVTTSVLLELISYRKTVLGAHHADHEKLNMTEDQQ